MENIQKLECCQSGKACPPSVAFAVCNVICFVGIVVVTDGMLGVTDLNLFDSLLAQLRSNTITCSFLRIGQTQCARCSFGLVPHVELLQFIASATFGTYLGDPHDDVGMISLNKYFLHYLVIDVQESCFANRALFVGSFQV
jgi:hypothetical protein